MTTDRVYHNSSTQMETQKTNNSESDEPKADTFSYNTNCDSRTGVFTTNGHDLSVCCCKCKEKDTFIQMNESSTYKQHGCIIKPSICFAVGLTAISILATSLLLASSNYLFNTFHTNSACTEQKSSVLPTHEKMTQLRMENDEHWSYAIYKSSKKIQGTHILLWKPIRDDLNTSITYFHETGEFVLPKTGRYIIKANLRVQRRSSINSTVGRPPYIFSCVRVESDNIQCAIQSVNIDMATTLHIQPRISKCYNKDDKVKVIANNAAPLIIDDNQISNIEIFYLGGCL